MSTTVMIYTPEESTEAPITLEFQWEGVPTFAYGLTLSQARSLHRDLHAALLMLDGATMPVMGHGSHRHLTSTTPLEVLDLEPGPRD